MREKRKMDDESLSPDELRKLLKGYGILTGPITPTTFPVYVRRLNSLRSRNSRVSQESRRASTGRSSSATASAAANLNGFSSDESDAESEGRCDRLPESDNYGVTTDYGRMRRNHQWDMTRSRDTVLDTAQPEGNRERNSSAYDTLSLVRPSIRTYNYDNSMNSNRYGISNSRIGASQWQAWNQRRLLIGSSNSTDVTDAGPDRAAGSGFDESRQSWQLISRVIVLVVLFFVIIVVVSYCFITRSSQLPIDTRSDYVLCSSEAPEGSSLSLKCTSRLELGMIQKMIRELLDALSMRAGDYDCGYQSNSRSMCRTEVIRLLDDTMLIPADKKAAEYLPLIKDMCLKNDHWGIVVYGRSTENDFALESTVGKKSLWCRITDSARYIFSVIVLTFLFVGACCGLFVFIRFWRNAAEAEHREVLDLVEEIIDMLRQNAAAAETAAADPNDRPVPPYLAIPHLRDALIPLHLRRAKQRVWDRAVKFLSAHESRVRVEHQQILGEEFAVWRWIQPALDGAKVWQGQAFGENTTALRSRHRSSVPQNPLTTCLKIRNMFDVNVETGSVWKQTVQDAVLEKCGSATIIHIAVDSLSTEGCVYVRCSDLESAGIAFKGLHGWWFDGRLVTVKYLREQRYEEHYPESRGASTAILPSNNARLSLSQPFHSSIIENS